MISTCLSAFPGFAAFFSVFEVTRRIALQAKDTSKRRVDQLDHQKFGSVQRHLPKMIHGLTLVSGGVSYSSLLTTCK